MHSTLPLSSAHVKFDVWTGPEKTVQRYILLNKNYSAQCQWLLFNIYQATKEKHENPPNKRILSKGSQYSSILTLSPFILLAVCPKMATLNQTSGVLTSPYYPKRYPSNEKCSWKIIASKGERIVLVIKDIYIRNCGSSCTCDYLEIQNGSSSDGISGRRRCRSDKDSGIVYHSAKDVLRLTFVSGAGTYWWYRGFKATYIKVKYNATTTGKSLEIGF